MVIWNRRGSPIVNAWKASVWAECNVRTEWVPEYFCCSCWERTWVLAEHCVSLGKLNIIHQCMIGCSLHYPEEKNHAILGNLKLPGVLVASLLCHAIIHVLLLEYIIWHEKRKPLKPTKQAAIKKGSRRISNVTAHGPFNDWEPSCLGYARGTTATYVKHNGRAERRAGRDETRRDATAAGRRRLPLIHPSQRPCGIHHSEFLPVNSYISSSVASFSPPYLVWLRLLDLSLLIPFNTSCLWFGSALSISRQVLWFLFLQQLAPFLYPGKICHGVAAFLYRVSSS